jgi:hypothetical protein
MSPSNPNNYNDIAYNLGACHHGYLLEGRSTRNRPKVRGGANGNARANAEAYSIVALWGSNDPKPPQLLLQALRAGIVFMRLNASASNEIPVHSDFSQTSCPGSDLRGWARDGAPVNDVSEPEEEEEESVSINYRTIWTQRHKFPAWCLNAFSDLRNNKTFREQGYTAHARLTNAYGRTRQIWREINRRSWWDKGALAFWNRPNPNNKKSYGAMARQDHAKIDAILNIVQDLRRNSGAAPAAISPMATLADTQEHFEDEEFEPVDDVVEEEETTNEEIPEFEE